MFLSESSFIACSLRLFFFQSLQPELWSAPCSCLLDVPFWVREVTAGCQIYLQFGRKAKARSETWSIVTDGLSYRLTLIWAACVWPLDWLSGFHDAWSILRLSVDWCISLSLQTQDGFQRESNERLCTGECGFTSVQSIASFQPGLVCFRSLCRLRIWKWRKVWCVSKQPVRIRPNSLSQPLSQPLTEEWDTKAGLCGVSRKQTQCERVMRCVRKLDSRTDSELGRLLLTSADVWWVSLKPVNDFIVCAWSFIGGQMEPSNARNINWNKRQRSGEEGERRTKKWVTNPESNLWFHFETFRDQIFT